MATAINPQKSRVNFMSSLYAPALLIASALQQNNAEQQGHDPWDSRDPDG
jgi:hypothetical protein